LFLPKILFVGATYRSRYGSSSITLQVKHVNKKIALEQEPSVFKKAQGNPKGETAANSYCGTTLICTKIRKYAGKDRNFSIFVTLANTPCIANIQIYLPSQIFNVLFIGLVPNNRCI